MALKERATLAWYWVNHRDAVRCVTNTLLTVGIQSKNSEDFMPSLEIVKRNFWGVFCPFVSIVDEEGFQFVREAVEEFNRSVAHADIGYLECVTEVNLVEDEPADKLTVYPLGFNSRILTPRDIAEARYLFRQFDISLDTFISVKLKRITS